jgi:hypothetical protein
MTWAKREVLFGRANTDQEQLVNPVAITPESAPPIDAVAAGPKAAATLLQGRREFARRRHAIISASAGLRGRELIKLASLAEALAATLCRRGGRDPAASLTGEVGIAVFRTAFERWIDDGNEQDFPRLVQDSLDQLNALTVASDRDRTASSSPPPANFCEPGRSRATSRPLAFTPK